jgi:hypothetical protein
MTVDMGALRLVLELELHRKLLVLRRRFLLDRDKPNLLFADLIQSISSFAALFRGVLRLTMLSTPPQNPAEVFTQLAQVVSGYSPDTFLAILEARHARRCKCPANVTTLYTRLMDEVGRVTAYVDACSTGYRVQTEGVC